MNNSNNGSSWGNIPWSSYERSVGYRYRRNHVHRQQGSFSNEGANNIIHHNQQQQQYRQQHCMEQQWYQQQYQQQYRQQYRQQQQHRQPYHYGRSGHRYRYDVPSQQQQQQQPHHFQPPHPAPPQDVDDQGDNNREDEETVLVDTNELVPQLLPQLLAGQHVHNNFDFLNNSRDTFGVLHSDGGSPRTLSIDLAELAMKVGSLSSLHLQFWAFKQNYFDCILFIRCGTMYQILHHDADNVVELLGLTYQRGVIARACFHHTQKIKNTNILVDNNHKVALIEECDSQQQPRCKWYETVQTMNGFNIFSIDNRLYTIYRQRHPLRNDDESSST